MKKIMLLCSIALCSACSTVGASPNGAKIEKQTEKFVIIGLDNAADVCNVLSITNEIENLLIIVDDEKTFGKEATLFESLIRYSAPPDLVKLFDSLDPMNLEILKTDHNTPYIMPGQVNNKGIPKAEHLFHPLKLC